MKTINRIEIGAAIFLLVLILLTIREFLIDPCITNIERTLISIISLVAMLKWTKPISVCKFIIETIIFLIMQTSLLISALII